VGGWWIIAAHPIIATAEGVVVALGPLVMMALGDTISRIQPLGVKGEIVLPMISQELCVVMLRVAVGEYFMQILMDLVVGAT
jgi:hypothetical protein